MTESEWQKCRDPQGMLAWLRHAGTPSERKLTLLAVALCRRVQHLLTDDYVRHCREAIEAWEKYADGLVTDEQLQTATGGAFADALDAAHAIAHPAETDFYAISFAAEAVEHAHDVAATTRAAARAVAYDAVARVCDDTVATIAASWKAQGWQGRPQWDADEAIVAGTPTFRAARDTESAAQCNVLRDIFGNSFRPAPIIEPAVLAWNERTVARLARRAYEERPLPGGTLEDARLAVLADALEEAGLSDVDMLAHLRGPGPHVRGCWPVDCCLGKS